MKKTKVRYYVDIVDKEAGQTVVTVYDSYNSDEAYDVASHWNEDLLGAYCICNNPSLIAEVYEVEEDIEEEEKMQKYTLKDYEKFCEEALIMPPFEDDDQIDEWFDSHKIHIIANDCMMELDYDADAVNEIDFALREIHEAILGSGEATTGNTVGSEYRPATLKDLVKVAVREEFWHCGAVKDFGEYIRWFIRKHKSIGDILHCYEYICKDIKDYTETYKCDFSRLNMDNMRNVNSDTIKRIVGELIGTDRELLYGVTENDESSDIVFVMDYTLKESGELIGWFYGQDNIDEGYVNDLIEDYKNKLFEEEN